MVSTDLDKSLDGSKRAGRTYLGPTVGRVESQDNTILITDTGTTTVDLNVTLIEVNAPGLVTIKLPKTLNIAPLPGTLLDTPVTIVDISGAAGTNVITYLAYPGELIAGVASGVVSSDYGAVVLSPLTAGGWTILSYSTPADPGGGYVQKAGDTMTGTLNIFNAMLTIESNPSFDWMGIGAGMVPTRVRILDGSLAVPVTTMHTPTVYINKIDKAAFNGTTDGSDNAALFVNSLGLDDGAAGVISATGIFGRCESIAGSGCDVLGVGGQGIIAGAVAPRFAYGGFFNVTGYPGHVQNSLVGCEIFTGNAMGFDCPYNNNPSTFPQVTGITMGAGGTNLSTVAVWIRCANLFVSSQQYDIGILYTDFSVKTTAFHDDSTSINIIKSNTAHTNGVNLSSATFSGNAFASPGFSVNGTGTISTAQPLATGVGLDCNDCISSSVANGGNFPLFPATGGFFIGILNLVTGTTALYLASGGQVTLIAEIGGEFVASTTTPGAGDSSIAYDGATNYRIYNNSGGNATYSAAVIRL